MRGRSDVDKQYQPPDDDPELDPDVSNDVVQLRGDDPIQKDEEQS
jgi:hypothetical protein